jgi:large subunit ribosomal protein L14
MIQSETIVKITDNGGGKIGKVFKILGGSKKRYAEIGDFGSNFSQNRRTT